MKCYGMCTLLTSLSMVSGNLHIFMKYYKPHPHFTDEEAEAQTLGNFPRVTKQLSVLTKAV